MSTRKRALLVKNLGDGDPPRIQAEGSSLPDKYYQALLLSIHTQNALLCFLHQGLMLQKPIFALIRRPIKTTKKKRKRTKLANPFLQFKFKLHIKVLRQSKTLQPCKVAFALSATSLL